MRPFRVERYFQMPVLRQQWDPKSRNRSHNSPLKSDKILNFKLNNTNLNSTIRNLAASKYDPVSNRPFGLPAGRFRTLSVFLIFVLLLHTGGITFIATDLTSLSNQLPRACYGIQLFQDIIRHFMLMSAANKIEISLIPLPLHGNELTLKKLKKIKKNPAEKVALVQENNKSVI